MKRAINFSAGPAILPEAVLKQAANEIMDYQGTGVSVMEMSHRSHDYQMIIDQTEKDLRKLLDVPKNYKILFLQGGASTQFAMIPMNLMNNNRVADYVVTGAWSKKAAKEAEKYGKINVVASSEDKSFNYIPDLKKVKFSDDADYVHICENNTIYGTKFSELPDTKGKIIVTDLSSSILSEPLDVSKYGLIYAGAQKNIGPAGVTVVIIREDLLTTEHLPQTPLMMRYKVHADAGSMYNTPPTYGIYLCGLAFKWLLNQGGLKAIQKINIEKAMVLYDYLDESEMFSALVAKQDRSLMNICFKTNSAELDTLFIKEAKENGFVNLKGHRSIGGMRASTYNAMPISGIRSFVEFMKEFAKKNAGNK